MILVTVTKIQGVELADSRDIAIDPEKIVSVRLRDGITELDYAESYNRRWETIKYQVTAAVPNIEALITGTYVSKVYLTLAVVWAEQREWRPIHVANYALNIQEKYIIDMETVPVWYNGAEHTVTKIRFIPGSFVPVTIYVSNDISTLITDTPSDTTTTTLAPTTTTTTAAPVTTTTTEEPVTTTTEEVTTTTTPIQ